MGHSSLEDEFEKLAKDLKEFAKKVNEYTMYELLNQEYHIEEIDGTKIDQAQKFRLN